VGSTRASYDVESRPQLHRVVLRRALAGPILSSDKSKDRVYRSLERFRTATVPSAGVTLGSNGPAV
jgi:hypothetical protein